MNDRRRREFLREVAGVLAAWGFGRQALAMQHDDGSGIPKRTLGRTGERVSIIGIGGYHIRLASDAEAIAIMHEAIDEGVTFFDNAWDYHNGGSEELMGRALAGGWRDKVFLMTKCCDRHYEGVKKQIDESLRRLRTDHIDLIQFHEINWSVDPDWVFERGGIKAAIEAQKAGKVRYIGFTGHRDMAHLLKMLGKPYQWATAQMPINILDMHYRSFQKNVLPECIKRGVAVIGMKGLASGKLPRRFGIPAQLCRRFALTLPISTLVCGIQSRRDLHQDLAMARNFKPVDEAEIRRLADQTREFNRHGEAEHYKTTRYGGAYHFRQHGE